MDNQSDSHLDFVLDFLKDLERNNTRIWMHQRAVKRRYDVVKRVFEKFISLLLLDMSDIESTRGLKAKDCIFRIWRDTRFSKDKTPCKTWLSAVIRSGGRNNDARAAYYIHIQPGGRSFIGGGIYMPDAPKLKLIRQAIIRDGKHLARIAAGKSFRKTFGDLEPLRLKTMPRDFRSVVLDEASREMIRHTSWIASRELTDKEVVHPHFYKTIVDTFATLAPMNHWLNSALEKDLP
jgi:uncharacterized protein (TIGR02453 family)